MQRILRIVGLIVIWGGVSSLCTIHAQTEKPPRKDQRLSLTFPELSYTEISLSNGLRIIIHEDHKSPVVAVNLIYLVGSKDEQPEKTGLAHLFEHLLFTGSVHVPGKWYTRVAPLGLTDDVAFTHPDLTRLGGTVPTASLDNYLWIEGDRMGHFVETIDQKKIDAERGVIENEVRQTLNQPYGDLFRLIAAGAYPVGHPYHHEPLGSMEQLKGASVEDVKAWFQSHYGPNNAVLILAGDIDAQTARAKVERYFGWIPPGPSETKYRSWAESMSSDRRETILGNVPNSRIYEVWNGPGLPTGDYDFLQLLAGIIAGGPDSRLSRRLVDGKHMLSNISVSIYPRVLGSSVILQADVRPDFEGKLQEVEESINAALNSELSTPPTVSELNRVMNGWHAAFLREIERVGGNGGQADQLGWSLALGGRPDEYLVKLRRMSSATGPQVTAAAERWLAKPALTLEYQKLPNLTAQPATTPVQEPPAPALVSGGFPVLQSTILENGLRVIVGRRTSGELVAVHLVIGGGIAADSSAKAGINRVLLESLQRGTEHMTRQEINISLNDAGELLNSTVNPDYVTLEISGPKSALNESIALLAEMVEHPGFTVGTVKDAQQAVLSRIKDERATPRWIVRRLAPELLYGLHHPYSMPATGTGTEESVASLTPDDLKLFHKKWFVPSNATLVVVGPVSLQEVRKVVQQYFAAWVKRPKPELPDRSLGSPVNRGKFFIVNRPGSSQCDISVIYSAPEQPVDASRIEMLGRIISGDANSRMGRDLREEKHWAYFTALFSANSVGPGPFVLRIPVQDDRIKESILEIRAQLSAISDEEPITEAEMDRTRRAVLLGLPGTWELTSEVANFADQVAAFNLDSGYWNSYPQRVNSVRPSELEAVVKDMNLTKRAIWLLIGDAVKIRSALNEMGETDISDIDVP